MINVPKSKKQQIIDYLQEQKGEAYINQIAKDIGTTNVTVWRWVNIMSLEGLINVRPFGQMKMVSLVRKSNKQKAVILQK